MFVKFEQKFKMAAIVNLINIVFILNDECKVMILESYFRKKKTEVNR